MDNPLLILVIAAIVLAPLMWWLWMEQSAPTGGHLPESGTARPVPPSSTTPPYGEAREPAARPGGAYGQTPPRRWEEERKSLEEAPPLEDTNFSSERQVEHRPPLEVIPAHPGESRGRLGLGEGPMPEQRVRFATPVTRARRRSAKQAVLRQIRSRAGLRQAILVQAIIGPPKALAPEDDGRLGG